MKTVKSIWKQAATAFAVAGVALTIALPEAAAQSREPLKMAGKQTLYQRVLTRPGAELSDAPEQSGEVQDTFSRYYVYDSVEQGGVTWLEVGPDSKGSVSGWIPASDTVKWKQQLALSFSPATGRSPALFFKDRATLEGIVGSFTQAEDYDAVVQSLESKGADPRVLAKEPDKPVDIEQQFYLLPILDAAPIMAGSGHQMNLLNVASVSAAEPKSNTSATVDDTKTLRTFNAAIVFVIDSTISMGPYIERTKQAVEQIYASIEDEGVAGQVKFGLYAYRADTTAAPGLEYVNKEYINPVDFQNADDFLEHVRDLKPAPVSSKAFDEDAYAGISQATSEVDWTQFGGRYIILITDAGALKGNSQYSKTGLGAAEVQAELKNAGIALYALHLKTPQGANNHDSAEKQYKAVSFNDVTGGPLYYGIEAGDVDVFTDNVQSLGDEISAQVKAAYRGEMVPGSARSAAPTYGKAGGSEQAQKVAEDAAKIGHAMALRYLGRKQNSQAPDVFEAWITDRDPANPLKPTTEVRVLLTKNQLSDLQEIVQIIADAALEGMINPDEMFDQLRSAAVTLGRDPNQLSEEKTTKLVELGLFGEYLDGLPPYPSSILALTAAEWETYSGQQQDDIILNLNRKLRLYERMNADLDRWVRLADDADPSEDVYPVPLASLP